MQSHYLMKEIGCYKQITIIFSLNTFYWHILEDKLMLVGLHYYFAHSPISSIYVYSVPSGGKC